MASNLHMNGRQLEIEKAKLKDEKAVLKELKASYQQASKDIANNIRIQQGRINVLLKDIDNLSEVEKSILQAATYQKQFQERLKKQIDGYIDTLNSAQHSTMDKYLKQCYDTGFIGSIYDMHGQGVPIIAPINQKQVARATALTPKLSRKMYGTYAGDVKQAVRREISRGIATADSFSHIARNVNSATNMGFNRMMRIVRTEGHRIQSMSAFDAQHAAKDAGADIVKQWNAALDGKTRDTHRQLDGQIRELDEPFEVGGMTAMYPSDFGDPAEDINCRCALQQRAKWALDEDELQTLKDRAAYFGLDKSKRFADFEKKYLKAADETSAAAKDMYALAESISNKHGININVDLVKNMPDTVSRNLRALDELLDNYKHTVVDYQFAKSTNAEGGSALMINGKTAIKISPKNIKTAVANDKLNIGKNLDVSTTYHEFAHALSQSREKIDPEFWKEVKKIRTQYRKELKDIEKAEIVDHTMTAAEAQIAKKKIFISNYANTDIDEFLAEAFTQAKLAKNPSLYSQKVLEVVDKYFKKKTVTSAKILENSVKSSTLKTSEMFRRSEGAKTRFKPISKEKFDALTIPAKKKGANIMIADERWEKRLRDKDASAVCIGDTLIFRKDACLSDILEETYHFEQNLKGMNDDKSPTLRTILNEIDAQKYLLDNAAKYKIPRNETEHTKKLLKKYEDDLKRYQKGKRHV